MAHVSFWLVPSEPYRSDFQDLIARLAQTYQATPFLPHVTLQSGPVPETVDLEQVMAAAVQGISGFTLEAVGVQQSPVFAKTVFVQLQSSDVLLQLAQQIRQALPDLAGYQLNPHLSLIYQTLDPGVRQGVADAIELPQAQIAFDEVQAVAAPDAFQTQADVRQLRCLYRRNLGA
ncbi:MAG: 2'-5' RNA ligase family protein [Cyanobacteria bacterium Co-bin13]|nr:2'-5' RNA ligase family protein [Cyanobacteria bacterium Co-bin13]